MNSKKTYILWRSILSTSKEISKHLSICSVFVRQANNFLLFHRLYVPCAGVPLRCAGEKATLVCVHLVWVQLRSIRWCFISATICYATCRHVRFVREAGIGIRWHIPLVLFLCECANYWASAATRTRTEGLSGTVPSMGVVRGSILAYTRFEIWKLFPTSKNDTSTRYDI